MIFNLTLYAILALIIVRYNYKHARKTGCIRIFSPYTPNRKPKWPRFDDLETVFCAVPSVRLALAYWGYDSTLAIVLVILSTVALALAPKVVAYLLLQVTPSVKGGKIIW